MNKFYICIIILSVASFASGANDKKTEILKDEFRRGFELSCEPTITVQINRAGLSGEIRKYKKINYCKCVAIKIFNDLTPFEVERFMTTDLLPDRKRLKRSNFSEECASKELY